MACVLQEAGDADPKCKLILNLLSLLTLLHISIKFSHLCQGYHDHHVFTANDGVWKNWGEGVDSFMFGFGFGDSDSFYYFSMFFYCR